MTWDFLWFLIPIAGIIFAFLLASRKGKNKLIKMNIGEVLEDYGNFSELQDQQLGISSDQNLRLLKCKSKEGIIYVLEAQRG
ncbi:MAG: hypothetical protein HYU80_04120 [Candidatus Blackburnbacteria bacterium]|nr:hypothetical protein [Candidatus Blackburnbacteria bacterium]